MEKDFELELNNHDLYQFLRSNSGCKVYWLSDNGENSATFGCNGSSVYFYRKDGTYRRVEMTEECRKLNSQILLNDINTIVRVEKYFDDNYKSVIVLANPKTIINTKAAPREIKNQIIRSDQLIAHIKKLDKERTYEL